MANFSFPGSGEVDRQRRESQGFQDQVQGFLDQVHRDMVSRKGTTDVAAYLAFPPNTGEDAREAVRDAINDVNNGQDWDAQLSTNEGQPVLLVYKRQS